MVIIFTANFTLRFTKLHKLPSEMVVFNKYLEQSAAICDNCIDVGLYSVDIYSFRDDLPVPSSGAKYSFRMGSKSSPERSVRNYQSSLHNISEERGSHLLRDGSLKSYNDICSQYRHAPHNDVSVNDGPHIRRRSHNIINIIILTIMLQLPTVFSTVTCCTGL